MPSKWPKVTGLYHEIGNSGGRILQDEWKQNKYPRSREGIALHEQVIQDFLRDIFQPLVGEKALSEYLKTKELSGNLSFGQCIEAIYSQTHEDSFPRLTLIGGHYRSSISVKGRRSSITVNRKELRQKLTKFFTPGAQADESTMSKPLLEAFWANVDNMPFFLDLWQAVFLDQYFRLFGKPTTMNEWVLEKLPEKSTTGVLVEFEASEACCYMPIGTHWICIAFPKDLCDILLDTTLCASFYTAITSSVNHVVNLHRHMAPTLLKPSGGDDRPKTNEMYDWFELLRDANLRSWAILEESAVPALCELRSLYIAGKLIHEKHDFASNLLRYFSPGLQHNEGGPHTQEINTFNAIKHVVKVFQAMLIYVHLYGNLYMTFPFFPEGQAPGCSLTFMKEQEKQIPNGLAWMNEYADGLRDLGTGIFDNIMAHARNCYQDAAGSEKFMEKGLGILWPDLDNDQCPAYLMWNEINKFAKDQFTRDWFRFILALPMNLATAKHEGKELSFSFLLGNPHNLVHDLVVEHEFLMREHQLKLGPEKLNVALSLSLIKGNYAFLQDPELALFVSYPGYPLEITNIVRLTERGERQRSRRALLRAVTKGKKDLIGTVSYGNGRADVFYDGTLIGSYSGREWQKSSGYEVFWSKLEDHVEEHVKVIMNKPEMLTILKASIERISDEPGQGALIALGNNHALEDLMKQSTPLTRVFDSVEKRRIVEAGEDLFVKVAIEDGATLINTSTGQISGRWLLQAINPQRYHVKNRRRKKGKRPTLLEAWNDNTLQNPYYWEHWYKTLKWGTRHLAALGASLTLGDNGIVIVISADGPVHVLKKGKALMADKDDLVYGE